MRSALDFGTRLHEKFEYVNFKDETELKDEPLAFSRHLFNGLSLKDAIHFIHEYAFSYQEKDTHLNGIIDLLVIYEHEVHIIDYKTKNINEEKIYQTTKSLRNIFKASFQNQNHPCIFICH